MTVKIKPRPEGRTRRMGESEDVEIPEPQYAWMGKSHQWGTRVKAGDKGLTLGSLNVGHYAEVPEFWEDQTRMPRGSVAGSAVVPPIGYSVRHKSGLWADCAGDLYEEAIQRRWVPTTDLDWSSVEPLDDAVERAMCQLCTELIQCANVEMESIASWQEELSYGFHEVKQFLATVTFDDARHMDAFRKRALANGGGLGVESKGILNRMILESRGGWTETVAVMFLQRGLLTQTIYKHGVGFAHNAAEREMFSRSMQDKARHLTYAVEHLKYAVNHNEGQGPILNQVLTIGEGMLIAELKDPALRESLMILLAGSLEAAPSAGKAAFEGLMGDYLRQYAALTDWIGVSRDDGLPPDLARYLEA
jgi:hypothetical protein